MTYMQVSLHAGKPSSYCLYHSMRFLSRSDIPLVGLLRVNALSRNAGDLSWWSIPLWSCLHVTYYLSCGYMAGGGVTPHIGPWHRSYGVSCCTGHLRSHRCHPRRCCCCYCCCCCWCGSSTMYRTQHPALSDPMVAASAGNLLTAPGSLFLIDWQCVMTTTIWC
jgi:hypothetical protein